MNNHIGKITHSGGGTINIEQTSDGQTVSYTIGVGAEAAHTLTRTLDAIKSDPHGTVARHFCHWSAVHVMRWELKPNPPDSPSILYYFSKYGLEMEKSEWNPLSDANHALMLLESLCEKPVSHLRIFSTAKRQERILGEYAIEGILSGAMAWSFYCLEDCYDTKTLTNDEMKGWHDELC